MMRHGGDFQLSADKQKILDDADEYLQNHVGRKLFNRTKPAKYLEDRIKALIEEKTAQMEKMAEAEDTPEKRLLIEELQQLNQAYSRVKPKAVTLKDLEEPDVEVDK